MKIEATVLPDKSLSNNEIYPILGLSENGQLVLFYKRGSVTLEN